LNAAFISYNEYSLSIVPDLRAGNPIDKRKDKTRAKLREAVVADAVERGFGAVSVAGVVNRAKVSAGTVYVHFDNKEDMLQKVFLDIKREFHAIMLCARDELRSDEMIRRMWFDMFDFVSKHPSDFLFLEYGSAAHFLDSEQKKEVDGMYGDINDMIRRGVEDGTLVQLDISVVTLLLVSPAMQLARSAVLTATPIPPVTVAKTFEQVWRSIAADPLSKPPNGELVHPTCSDDLNHATPTTK